VNEQLAKDALATIETLRSKVAELTARCEALEGDLAKARSGAADDTVRGAIVKSLRGAGSAANPAVNPGDLITQMHSGSEAVKARRQRQADDEASFQEQLAKVRTKAGS
jgi:hypothetical protein